MSVLKKLIMIACVCCLFCACGKNVSEDTQISINQSDRVCIEGISDESTFEFCKEGMIYKQGNLFKYKDYQSGNSYILCGDANCRHNDDSCPAYDSQGQAYGLCYYNDFLYEFRIAADGENLQLLKVSLESNSKDVICSFPVGSYEPGGRVLLGMGDVRYAGHYVWTSIEYGQLTADEDEYAADDSDGFESYEYDYLGVNLENGNIAHLIETDSKYDTIEYEMASDRYVVFSADYFSETMLSEKEFEDALQNGQFTEYASEEFPYYKYQCAFRYSTEKMEDIILYETDSGEMSVLSTDQMYKDSFTYEDGSGTADANFLPRYVFEAIIGDDLYYTKDQLASAAGQETEGTIYLYRYDLLSGEETPYYDMTDRSFVLTNTYNYNSSCLLNGTECLLAERVSDDERKLYIMDLVTLETQDLFTDDYNISFRPAGETDDSYLGQMVDERTGSDGLYSIPKEDFCSGNLSAAKHMLLN